MTVQARPLAGLLVLIMASASCIGGRSVGDTSAIVVGSVVGNVRAHAAGSSSWHAIAKGDSVPIGSTVQVPAAGSVVLKRGEVSSVQLVPYDGQPAELRLTSVESVEALTGDVLVKADQEAPISVTSQGISAVPKPSEAVKTPIFRFDRRVSIRVGVYTGDAAVSALEGTLPIPPLREGVVAARELPPAATPLTVDPRDPFDRQLLLDVIDLDADLASDSRGYEAAYGARMKSWREIARIAPGRDLSFTDEYLSDTGSADILIGVIFALLLEQRSHRLPDFSFRSLMALRDQGATWGLLARQYLGADARHVLLDAVTRAIALRTGEIKTPGGAVPPASPSPSATPTTTTSPSTSPSPTKKPSPSATPSPSVTPTLTPTPSPSCILVIFCS
jgi:hypothetical protein